MKIHIIAIGGAAMHNIALALKANGHSITGSDDEIYNPAKDRLDKEGLLPKKMGWNPSRIHEELDAINALLFCGDHLGKPLMLRHHQFFGS